MSGIRDRVAIVGMGCSQFGERWEADEQDLIVESCYEAFADAGIEAKDIQAAWYGTFYTGLSGTRLAYALKFNFIPVTRIENFCCTAIDAFRNAAYAVAAGVYDLVLACGVEKLKDSGYSGLPTVGFESGDHGRYEPITSAPSIFAVAATRYFYTYGLTYDEGKRVLGSIAVKNHHNGSLCPKAHLRREITLEQAISARMIAWPLGLFDCCGVSDGSAAAVITTPEIAKKMRDDYVLIKGFGIACGGMHGQLLTSYDYVHWDENLHAARQAYEEAGIKDPAREISIAQVHDCFTSTELITMEDLGFAPRGEGWKEELAGAFTLEGRQPVNTDGGLKCFGHPIGASGLRMMYENYKQIQGKAQDPARQVKDVKLALAHNLGGGPANAVVGVSILGARD